MFLLPDHPVHEDNDAVDNNTPSSAAQRPDALCVLSRHSVVRLNLRQRNCVVPALTPSIHHARCKKVCRVFFFLSLPPLWSVAVRKGAPPHAPPCSFNSSSHFKWRGWCSSCCSASLLVQGSSCSRSRLTLHSATHLCHATGQPPTPLPFPPSTKNCLCGPHVKKRCVIEIFPFLCFFVCKSHILDKL